MKNNNADLKFTGERLMTEIYEYWSIEHLHRYALALNLISKKKVLDIASGEGYGTFLMSDVADKIVGVDISEAAVTHASNKYQKFNLSFLKGSATQIPLENSSVDVVVSFETIEHHKEHDKMMQEINRVLIPGGILIISSPDKKYYSDLPKYNNPFHVKELYADEFYQLVKKYFSNVLMLNQKTIFGSFISSSGTINIPFIEFSGDYTNINTQQALQHAPYNICIASNEALNNLPVIEQSVFCNQNLFKMYTSLKDENQRLNNLNIMLGNKLKRPAQKLVNMIEFPFKVIKRMMLLRK